VLQNQRLNIMHLEKLNNLGQTRNRFFQIAEHIRKDIGLISEGQFVANPSSCQILREPEQELSRIKITRAVLKCQDVLYS